MEYAEALFWELHSVEDDRAALLGIFGSRDDGEELVCIHVVLLLEAGNQTLQIDEHNVDLDILGEWEENWIAIERANGNDDCETWDVLFSTPEEMWQYLEREEFRDRDSRAVEAATSHIKARHTLQQYRLQPAVAGA